MKQRRNKRQGKSFTVMLLMALLLCGTCLFNSINAQAATSGNTSRALVVPEGSDPSALDIPVSVLDGKRAGVMTGTPQDQIVQNNVADAQLNYYSSFTDISIALEKGKVDFFTNNTVQFRFIQKEYPMFSYVNAVLAEYSNGTIFPMDREALQQEFNVYIAEIREDGTLEQFEKYWLYPNDWEPCEIPAKGEKGTLKMATCTSMKPFSFVLNGGISGYDVAVVCEFCKRNGYGLKIEDCDFAGMLSGIATGKYDLAASQIAWTKERGESVLFSDLYFTQQLVAFVRTADFAEGGKTGAETTGFGASVKKSFRRTFVEESRWKVILNGLLATLVITVFGFILANLFGGLFCAMGLSRRKWLRVIADIYSRLMQGTPIVVILMILYYVVFGHTDLSGMLISILGFGLANGAYLAQIFRLNIRGVDPGQTEAALTLGMTRYQAFTGIVLPQAIRTMLPAYFSQLISLMKSTSIVGYIAVVDLTKAGDIIRSSTYEAFFPLLTSAAIYFIISCLLLSLLKKIRKRLAPKRRSKTPMSAGTNVPAGKVGE